MRLIRDGEKGVWRWWEREIIYLSLHCHNQNDSCICLLYTSDAADER